MRPCSVDTAVNIVQQLGRGTELIKLDVKNAYRHEGAQVLAKVMEIFRVLGIPEQPTRQKAQRLY